MSAEPELADRHCVPCSKATPALTERDYAPLLAQLHGWTVMANRLARELSFKDFADALAFVTQVGRVAEAEGHHPEIRLGWGRVGIEIWTHAIGGLSEADFVLAAKIDRLADGPGAG